MRLSEITRPINRVSADDVLVNAGYTRLGDGCYGAVYEKPDRPYVLKVFTAHDVAYLDFIKLAREHPNKYFPKFFGKIVKVTPTVCAIRMEKLKPMRGEWHLISSIRTYIRMRNHPASSKEASHEWYGDALDEFEGNPELQTACDLIIDNLWMHSLDLKPDNLMVRGKQIVFTDPVASPHASRGVEYLPTRRVSKKIRNDAAKWQPDDDRILAQLKEAAVPGGDTYWFNPANGEVITVGDHGEGVMEDPYVFGIDAETVRDMIEAFPDDCEEHAQTEDSDCDDLPPPPAELSFTDGKWSQNDAWEQLAMNRGWVRCGESLNNRRYLSAATASAAWAGAKFTLQHHYVEVLDIEISGKDGSFFVELKDKFIEAFVKAGPHRALGFLRMAS